jgi:hypothetical protein
MPFVCHMPSQGKSRLDQIVHWLGGETFDGLLVFDECHKAKNFTPGKEGSSTKIAANVLVGACMWMRV